MAKKVNRRLRALSEKPSDRGARYIPGEEDEGPILSQLGFLMSSVFAFILVTAAAAWFGSHQIADHIGATTAAELNQSGFPEVTVIADGRDVQLVGIVPENADVDAMRAIASNVDGVRNVVTRVTLAEVVAEEPGPAAADPLTLTWEDGAATISGTVSSEAVRDEVVARLGQAYPAGVDATELTVRVLMSPEDAWLPGVLDVIDTVAAAVDSGDFVVNGDAAVATITAELASRQERLEVRTVAEETLAEGPLAFISGLTVEDAPPPPEVEEVVELQLNLDELIEGKVVEFALNSDELTARGEALLDEVVEALRLVPDVGVEIAGHADTQGPDDLNMVLSQRRARAVFDYLVAAGEDPDRFQVIGYGETRPIADNATEEGRARNRRIEFIALLD